ncbi:hypothetical protein EDC65_4153 [Stella humosa]|uniref:RelE toxin of RelEB toxin-antitoxin system n=1 Tax=Stella humosa TaxID=94 RepID=A0A3N1L1W7_9PROT|nr:type II toxin-antitoxin system RelE/ParE family toxin [Stella humosa]ROP83505.1 hypothetical protein EDC65_4153 [Stella humosa]BBK33222.1 hypothetical protein STHU_38560 [Stella humosa]
MVERLVTVVETAQFLRRAKAVGLADAERAELVTALASDPAAGVPLGGGLYKMRFGRPGGGKSGGWRVLHFYRRQDLPVFLLSVFGKNEKANISTAERAALISLCDLIAEAYGRRA